MPNCEQCQAELVGKEYRTRFCNRSCAATFNNQKRTRAARPCFGCQTPTTKKPTKRVVYCSAACYRKTQYEDNVRRWLRGELSGGIKAGSVSGFVKRWLRTERGDACEQCGWSQKNPTTQRVPLQVDHKDGNSENHRPDNLRLLCPNCHSLTPTFGNLNKGRGRKGRYKKSQMVCRDAAMA